MKKLMSLLLILGLIFILGACGDSEGEYTATTEPATDATQEETRADNNDNLSTEFEFTIDIISAEEFYALERYIEVEYKDLDGIEGLKLLFDFNQPISEFALVEIAMLEDGEIVVTGVLHEIGDLGFVGLNEYLVLTNYIVVGTVPRSGFTFVDPDGNQYWYVFQRNQADIGHDMLWYSFSWNSDYAFYVPELPDNNQSDNNVNNNTTPPNAGTTRPFGVERFDAAEVALLGEHLRFSWAGSEMDALTDVNAVFTFSEDITDFKFLFVGMDDDGNFVNFGPAHSAGEAASSASVPAGKSIVLTHYNHVGTVSNSGFTFTDASGITHWYVFQWSMFDGSINAWSFDWDYGIAIIEMDYHEVAAGETLFSIARLHGLTVADLQNFNDLGDSTDISVGQMLNLGTGRVVRVPG